jgi:hypothetical protein
MVIGQHVLKAREVHYWKGRKFVVNRAFLYWKEITLTNCKAPSAIDCFGKENSCTTYGCTTEIIGEQDD